MPHVAPVLDGAYRRPWRADRAWGEGAGGRGEAARLDQSRRRTIFAMSDDSAEKVSPHLPVIDIAALVQGRGALDEVAQRMAAACREHGFFYVRGHGVDDALCARLESLSRAFFALDESVKMQWRMSLGGRAWRGYFPAGGELTSGIADWKEGLYFGSE